MTSPCPGQLMPARVISSPAELTNQRPSVLKGPLGQDDWASVAPMRPLPMVAKKGAKNFISILLG